MRLAYHYTGFSRSNGQRSGLKAGGCIPCRPNPAATPLVFSDLQSEMQLDCSRNVLFDAQFDEALEVAVALTRGTHHSSITATLGTSAHVRCMPQLFILTCDTFYPQRELKYRPKYKSQYNRQLATIDYLRVYINYCTNILLLDLV